MKKPAAESGPPAPAHGAGEADLSHMNIKDVITKHGPAHKVEIEHDHASGKHMVTSHHKGGHHKSQHGSADEAHMHAANAAGVQTPDDANEEATPYEGNETPAEEEAEEATPIPGVR